MNARLLAKRLTLSAITLLLLSAVVFAAGQLLPGDVGRSILGPLADARAVAALNHQLGTDQPALTMYLHWLGNLLRGDMGQSYAFRSPVAPFIGHALLKSVALAAMAAVIVVPAAIAAGVYAALRVGTWQDKLITLGGLSLTIVPEFVSGIILILILGVWLRWLPISANTRLFGYIARIARAGMLDALESDYTRTARLKGISPSQVLLRHVLRNALLPTITVVATQTSYLIGGLVVVETLFRYQGIGSLILTAARDKDFPMLEAGILVVGAAYVLSNVVADMLIGVLDPRVAMSRR